MDVGTHNLGLATILEGDVIDALRTLPDESVHCVATSPPYWGLRQYIADGAPEKPYEIGLESSPDEYVGKMVSVFREVRRVLRSDGCAWVNLGDSYNSTAGNYRSGTGHLGLSGGVADPRRQERHVTHRPARGIDGLKPKDLCGIPWRVAFTLQADGWWPRQDIIWCLSGGTWVYARTQKGDMPIMIRDLARLKPGSVQLWNGERWTRLLGMNKSNRRGDEIKIVLRSGERISCTPTHRFPTRRGLVQAFEIKPGDVLDTCTLPQPGGPSILRTWNPEHIGDDAAWLAGLYIAEGSRSGDTIQIAGHARETARWERCKRVAESYGGTATRTIKGNNMSIRIYGKILNALIDELVTGRTAIDKGFSPKCWRYDNGFLRSMLEGYLHGDGHHDHNNSRWRLGFTRNYNLERDIRTVCARLGYQLTLNLSSVKYKGKSRPTFRGEIRIEPSEHGNAMPRSEVVAIRKARCREVYDIGVADEPHVFALASGVLTHNSKPNPMPESVTDRCTKAHEYVFLLSKAASYFYDAEAVKEASVDPVGSSARYRSEFTGVAGDVVCPGDPDGQRTRPQGMRDFDGNRNRRSVWTIGTYAYPDAHFATYPPALVQPCIKAGTSLKGCCPGCGAPWERVTETTRVATRHGDGSKVHGANSRMNRSRDVNHPTEWDGKKSVVSPYHHADEVGNRDPQRHISKTTTVGWQPTCKCNAGEPVPCTVLDPFVGSGTTLEVATLLGRRSIGIELNPKYVELAKRRLADSCGLLLGSAAE